MPAWGNGNFKSHKVMVVSVANKNLWVISVANTENRPEQQEDFQGMHARVAILAITIPASWKGTRFCVRKFLGKGEVVDCEVP